MDYFNISIGATEYLKEGEKSMTELMDFHTSRLDKFAKSPLAKLDKNYILVSGQKDLAILYYSWDDEAEVMTLKEFGQQWDDILQVAAGEHAIITMLWDTE